MFKNASIYIAGFMVAVFLFMGSYFLFTDVMIDKLNGTKRYLFIGILFLYGIFRGYRVYSVYKQTKED